MNTDSKIHDDTKALLLAEVGKTALGQYLLAFLAERNIDVVLTNDVPQGHTAKSIAAAVWDPLNNRIVINPSEPLPSLMHFFAHEVRHVAQGEALRQHPNAIELAHPFNNVLLLRLQEMDADVFAVHFVANHALNVKPGDGQVPFFSTNSEPPPSHAMPAADGRGVMRFIDRSGMYRDYAESWRSDSHPADAAKAMAAAFRNVAANALITSNYAENALGNWEKVFMPLLREHKDDPDSYFAKAFRRAAARFEKNKLAPVHETLGASGRLFGALFPGAGVPDYFIGADYERMAKYLVEESPSGDAIFSTQAYLDQVEFFRKAARYYLEKAPVAAKKPTQGQSKTSRRRVTV